MVGESWIREQGLRDARVLEVLRKRGVTDVPELQRYEKVLEGADAIDHHFACEKTIYHAIIGIGMLVWNRQKLCECNGTAVPARVLQAIGARHYRPHARSHGEEKDWHIPYRRLQAPAAGQLGL